MTNSQRRFTAGVQIADSSYQPSKAELANRM